MNVRIRKTCTDDKASLSPSVSQAKTRDSMLVPSSRKQDKNLYQPHDRGDDIKQNEQQVRRYEIHILLRKLEFLEAKLMDIFNERLEKHLILKSMMELVKKSILATLNSSRVKGEKVCMLSSRVYTIDVLLKNEIIKAVTRSKDFDRRKDNTLLTDTW